ncbi:MAG: NAD(P)/FAD-dependent oxidoreductase [Alphaproteobacteria bacterium GM202ARS2]|nr:NAD(P)/FAD-dependent oxidoreductase [Alphaproteobacteria bacterium GM202ARS2]
MAQVNDIAIIGAGPVGLFTVFACGQLDLRCHVFDSLEEVGGQCAALYPHKPIYDIPGYPHIEASVLVSRLQEQAAPFEPTYHLQRRIVSLRGQDDYLVLGDEAGKEMAFKAVILAVGGGAFVPNKPPISNLAVFEDKSVFYRVTDPARFVGKKVVICGGGDSAVDWACALADKADVYVVHRRDKFRATPAMVKKLHDLHDRKKLTLVTPYMLESLDGDKDGTLKRVGVKTLKGDTKSLDADYVLAFFGLVSQLGPVRDWGLALKDNDVWVEPTTMATSKARVFAVGDSAGYDNKLNLILCGFSEASLAAQQIYRLLHAGKAPRFQYSTAKGDPKTYKEKQAR